MEWALLWESGLLLGRRSVVGCWESERGLRQ